MILMLALQTVAAPKKDVNTKKLYEMMITNVRMIPAINGMVVNMYLSAVMTLMFVPMMDAIKKEDVGIK